MKDLAIRMNEYSPLVRDPATYIQKGGYRVVYAFKEGLSFISNLTGAPGDLPSLMRKVTDAIGPALAHLGEFTATWKEGARHFIGLVEACDLLEVIGDAQYFLNGGFVKDYAKKRKFTWLARVALVPANIITVALHFKDVFKLSFEALGNCAAAVGNVRVFGFVPKLAAFAQEWPLVRSIPDLTGKAAALSEVRIFGFVSKITLGTVALVTVTVAYVYFFADALQRRNSAIEKMDKAAKKLEVAQQLKDKKVVVKPTDQHLKALFDRAGVDYSKEDHDQKELLGKDFVHYKSKQIKLQQANFDLARYGSELSLKAATIGGLAVGATVAGSVTVGVLGALSIVAIGCSAYYKFSAKKPELTAVID